MVDTSKQASPGDAELAAEFSGAFCELGEAIGVIAQKEAKQQARGGGKKSTSDAHKDWAQVIGHMDVMLSNEAREVQCTASTTLAVLGESSSEAKEQICNSPSMIRKLVHIISIGGLEAISAMAVLTWDHEDACNQVRESGGIPLLAAFITNAEQPSGDEPSGGKPSSSAAVDAAPTGDRQEPLHDSVPAANDPEAAAHSAVAGSSSSLVAPTEVPLASKADVVATLRNIAKTNDENRLAITREIHVIPQLVHLMTKKAEIDEKLHARDERIRIEQDMRKLAESAGQMLYTLICVGTKEVKDLIIGAIISRVQEPGTRPPEDVPELMTILRTAAEDQLSLTEVGDDPEALRRALEFGKWIKVTTTLLSEARNIFKAVREAREHAESERARRANLGFEASEAEVAAAIAVQIEKLKAAKVKTLYASKRRAEQEAAAELLQADAPTVIDAEEKDNSEALASSSEANQVKSKEKGKGAMKKGCERTPRKYIHTWFLTQQSSTDAENENDEEVELRMEGSYANLTDGEKPSKSSKPRKDKQQLLEGRRTRKAAFDEAAAGPTDHVVEAVHYEYGFVSYGHAGAGRKKVQAAQESLASQLTPVARQLIGFSMQLAELAQRSNLGERGAERVISPVLRGHLVRVIDHLALMLDSRTRQVKESASTTLGIMVNSDGAFKAKIAADLRIIAGLTKLMNEGVLEAITAVESLLAGNEQACNQAREAGAISILAGFINVEDGGGGKEGHSASGGDMDDERARKNQERLDIQRKGPSRVLQPGIYNLADLDTEMLEQAFVLMGVGADERMNAEGATQRIIPVEVKAQVVEALRHIALSNEENRERITQDKVIPALVKLMTKMQAAEDGKSGQSGQSGQSGNSGRSGSSDGSAGKKKGRRKKTGIGEDRQEIGRKNRRLAESAGRVLHELILLGSGVVKQKIISAIIATVQQPGSVPPEDVPALMTILRSAAEEQLMLVQSLDSLSGLLSALEFGRWIKVPIIKLGEARKNFMIAQEARKRQIRKGGPSTSADASGASGAPADAPAGAPAAEQEERRQDSSTKLSLNGVSNLATNAAAANTRSAQARPSRRKRSNSKERKKKLEADLLAYAAAEKEKHKRRYRRMERHMKGVLATMSEDADANPKEIGAMYTAYMASLRVDAEAHFMAQEAYIKASQLPQHRTRI